MKSGWKEGCRPILGVDGCFLKGPFKGELLTTVGNDANDQMYPVAWAVVEGENRQTWEWFIQLLQDDLDLGDGSNFTIMSDQQKGLKLAIENIVKATTERDWENKVSMLATKNKESAEELMKKKKQPKAWTRAFFDERSKCVMVDNSACESFNSIILDARSKCIITMLEDIREQTMLRIQRKRKAGTKWTQNYGPLVKEKFDASKKEGMDWQMVNYGENGCEIKKGRMRFVVDLKKKTCSCRYWQISGIPCPHACAAIWHIGGEPNDYMHSYFSQESYMKTYNYALHPINGSHEWKKTNYEPILPPLAPARPRGRPKKNRRKSKDEPNKHSKLGLVSRSGTIISCSNCGEEGHNKKGCKKPLNVNVKSSASTSRVLQPGIDKGSVSQAEANKSSNSMHAEGVDGNKGKNNLLDGSLQSVQRPFKMRRLSFNGFGLYTNVKTGEQTFYSGLTREKVQHAGNSLQRSEMAENEVAGTQESVKKARLG